MAAGSLTSASEASLEYFIVTSVTHAHIAFTHTLAYSHTPVTPAVCRFRASGISSSGFESEFAWEAGIATNNKPDQL